MAEALCEKLQGSSQRSPGLTKEYLEYLARQSVDSIRLAESQLLSQASHSLLLSVQALSKKSHKKVIAAATRHASLSQTLPMTARKVFDLTDMVSRLDDRAESFSAGFSKVNESEVMMERRRVLRLLQNSERFVDVMELPSLLKTAIRASPVNYSSTLDIYAHICRLASLYPSSRTVVTVKDEAEKIVRQMAADLIAILRAPHLKLAPGLRTIGWLKRIIPDIASGGRAEETLPAIFLVCRLSTLIITLYALSPLRRLADEEKLRASRTSLTWSGGQHTERYLKRFIEVFREHSFSIVSISKSVDASFPSALGSEFDPLRPLPPIISSFPMHLTGLLMETIRDYLPSVQDKAARESILTQVLYCAASLGRLGADFGVLLCCIGAGEWADLVKRHRLLAGRLESVIGESR
ncbi:Dor1-like protein [Moelleriella libera RCEF 2490]|uniref:Conserved oligomeric Golgi complex subunit 8 n=1 Tax=Moelleriella libera RCEF 2490 TaxID=1081109 RepID=A0A168B6F0_9HYPO|nr:Dor1-like protein [Moelleriella libera RCEF 2490]